MSSFISNNKPLLFSVPNIEARGTNIIRNYKVHNAFLKNSFNCYVSLQYGTFYRHNLILLSPLPEGSGSALRKLIIGTNSIFVILIDELAFYIFYGPHYLNIQTLESSKMHYLALIREPHKRCFSLPL